MLYHELIKCQSLILPMTLAYTLVGTQWSCQVLPHWGEVL